MFALPALLAPVTLHAQTVGPAATAELGGYTLCEGANVFIPAGASLRTRLADLAKSGAGNGADLGSADGTGSVRANARCSLKSTTVGDVYRHIWSVENSISYQRYVTDGAGADASGTAPAIVSPDGKRFFYIGFRGDVTCDCRIFELWVFDASEVSRGLAGIARSSPVKPMQVMKARTFGNSSLAILNPRWTDDSSNIVFIGRSEDGKQQVYQLDVASGAVKSLLEAEWTLETNSVALSRDAAFFTLYVPAKQSARSAGYPMELITSARSRAAWEADGPGIERQSFTSYRGGKPWFVGDSSPLGRPPEISSNGHTAIDLRLSSIAAADWLKYDNVPASVALSGDGKLHLDRGVRIALSQFMVIDAARQTITTPFDAPGGLVTKAGAAAAKRGLQVDCLWAKDGRHAVLINTALPLDSSDSGRAGMAYVVGLDVGSNSWKIIEPVEKKDPDMPGAVRRISAVGWLKEGVELLVRHDLVRVDGSIEPIAGTVYALEGNIWVGRDVSPALSAPEAQVQQPKLAGGLTVTLHQSANAPPVVVASNGRREIMLSAPDPTLEGVWRAAETTYRWRELDGSVKSGGVLLPHDFASCLASKATRENAGTPSRPSSACVPVPIVVQAYRYSPDVFNPQGSGASQNMVARGMAVINIPIPAASGEPDYQAAEELHIFADRLDAVLSDLASRGMVNRSRVGLYGFSRAGLNILYVITHPRGQPPAAAITDDSFKAGYGEYLREGSMGMDSSRQFERPYGGPFWSNKGQWLADEASFNIDRVQTPLLTTIHNDGPLALAVLNEQVGAFNLVGAPIEPLMFSEGQHELAKPASQAALINTATDWMAFWLGMGENSAPRKDIQYIRWRALDRLLEKRRAQIHATSSRQGKWIFTQEGEAALPITLVSPTP